MIVEMTKAGSTPGHITLETFPKSLRRRYAPMDNRNTLKGASRTCAPVASHASPRHCGEQTGTAMETLTLSRVASQRKLVRLRGRLPFREAGGKAALPAGRFLNAIRVFGGEP